MIPIVLLSDEQSGMIGCFIIAFICGVISVINQNTVFGLCGNAIFIKQGELGEYYTKPAMLGSAFSGLLSSALRVISKVGVVLIQDLI